jgi:small subunit ribosomal protein S17
MSEAITNPTGASSQTGNTPGAAQESRNRRRTAIGVVMSNKMAKTIIVGVERLRPHPVYEKYTRRLTRCYAHDEKGQAKVGDMVEIVSTRRLSKNKSWRLLRIVRAANVE